MYSEKEGELADMQAKLLATSDKCENMWVESLHTTLSRTQPPEQRCNSPQIFTVTCLQDNAGRLARERNLAPNASIWHHARGKVIRFAVCNVNYITSSTDDSGKILLFTFQLACRDCARYLEDRKKLYWSHRWRQGRKSKSHPDWEIWESIARSEERGQGLTGVW